MLTTRIFKTTLVSMCLSLAVQDGVAAIHATKIVNEQGRQINDGLLGKITQWLPEETWKKAAIAAAVIGVPAVLLIGGGMWRYFKKGKGGITDAEKPREEQSRTAGDAPDASDLSGETQSQDPDNTAGDPNKDAVDEKNPVAQPQNSGQIAPAEGSLAQVKERPRVSDEEGPAQKPTVEEQVEERLKQIVGTPLSSKEKIALIAKQQCPPSMPIDKFRKKRCEAFSALAEQEKRNILDRSHGDVAQQLREIQKLVEQLPGGDDDTKNDLVRAMSESVVDFASDLVKYADSISDLTAIEKYSDTFKLLTQDFRDTDEVRNRILNPRWSQVEQAVRDVKRCYTAEVGSYFSVLDKLSNVISLVRDDEHSVVSFARTSHVGESGRPQHYLSDHEERTFALRALMHDHFNCSWLEGDPYFDTSLTNAERRNKLIGKQLYDLLTAYVYAKETPDKEERVRTTVIASLSACKSLPQKTSEDPVVLPKILREESSKKNIREHMLRPARAREHFDALPADVKAAFESICGSN